jgi:hypothetical protein
MGLSSFLMLLFYVQVVTAAQTNGIIRNTNSVEVQLCVQTAFLTSQRDVFLQALTDYLTQSILNSNALYLDRQYTTTDGALCYLFVYQAPGPDNAVSVMLRLAEQTTLSVPFGTTRIECQVQAAQWSGDSLSYLGAPLPGLWTVNDLVLWGACFLTVLFLCMSGLCCYAFIMLHGAKAPHHLHHEPTIMTMKQQQQGGKSAHHAAPLHSSLLKLPPDGPKSKKSSA